MTAYVVEVNEGVIEASRQGVDWWLVFRARYATSGRLRETKPACIVGGLIEVACDDRDDADWLAAHMVDHGGLPRTAVRVKAAAQVEG
ncbi:hypothetical protein CSH63_17825 [Micromonospora tulbaghiae]|uniref:Uncharacterized protein n=1 Tax=Micromonospora tulbaghiae TaxID=479978 RepID=A0A386WPH3_9ACTN|nr:hypothetical protein [Micromonospora tulbaghiae]AYF29290.1 hypothetical protein CSH63_17825 [Micromonospora tulbaghiae]